MQRDMGEADLENGRAPATAGDLIDSCAALEREGRLAEALQTAARALELAESQGDRHTVGLALVAESRVRFRLGQYTQADALAAEALVRAPPKSLALVNALLLHGMCAAETSSLDQAEGFYRQALDLAREMGYTGLRCRALHNLASGVFLPRGRFDLALKADEEAYRMACASGLKDWAYFPLITIVWAHHLLGQRECMRRRLEELGGMLQPGWAAYGYYAYFLAELALDEGDFEGGHNWLTRAFESAEASGDPAVTIFVRLGMSRYHLLQGDAPTARTWAGDALVHGRRFGYQHLVGMALIECARTAWFTGDTAAAQADLESAVEGLQKLGAAFDLARARLIQAGSRFRLAAPDYSARRMDSKGIEDDTLLAAQATLAGGYEHLLDQERALALPLIAAHTGSANKPLAKACSQLMERFGRLHPEPLRVKTLGVFEVWQGRRLIEKRALNQRRAGELFAYLLLSPGHRLQFDVIVEAMWPDKDPAAAQTGFHHTTSALRRALEPDLPNKFPSRYLVVEEGTVTLRLPPGSQVDLEEFQAACKEHRWEAALSAYGGDLLDEFGYAPWQAVPRQRFSLLFQKALLALADEKLKAGQFAEALEYSRHLLAIDPWQEPAVLTGMRACLGVNNRAGALRLYRDLAKTLREELDVEPCDELQKLACSLLGK